VADGNHAAGVVKIDEDGWNLEERFKNFTIEQSVHPSKSEPPLPKHWDGKALVMAFVILLMLHYLVLWEGASTDGARPSVRPLRRGRSYLLRVSLRET
jgi:hypothetical protein